MLQLPRLGLLPGALLLLVLLFVGYAPSHDGAFQFDDLPSIADNPAVKDLAGFVRAHMGSPSGALERPIADLTFAFDYWRAGLDPAAFHTTCFLVHLLAVGLAFLFARETLRRAGYTRPGGLALAAAGLWGLHPLLSQAVSYIVQRAEALASLFYLTALMLLLAAYRRGRNARGAALYAAGLVASYVGLQAKLIAVTLPAALLLHLAVFEIEPPEVPAARRWRSRFLAAAPLLALSVATILGALRALHGHSDAGFEVPRLGTGSYALTQFRAVSRYLGLVLWPSGQNLDYDLPLSKGLLSPPATLLAGAVLAALAGGAAWLLRRARRDPDAPAAPPSRVAAFGVAWFLLLLSPTSSFVPVVDVVVEHRAYLASLGIVLATAAAVEFLVSRLVPPGRRLLAGLLLTAAGWGVLTVALRTRNEVWSSPVALWADVAAKSPRKARAHFNLGYALAQAGRDREAIPEYNVSAMLLGKDTVDWFRVLRNLGASLVAVGRHDDAIAVLSQVLPSDPASPEIHNNLALAWKRKGSLDRAEFHVTQALHASPTYAQAFNTLGEIRVQRGDLSGALVAFATAARYAPDILAPTFNVGLMQEALGLRQDACATWLRYGRLRGGEERVAAEERLGRLRCAGAAPR